MKKPVSHFSVIFSTSNMFHMGFFICLVVVLGLRSETSETTKNLSLNKGPVYDYNINAMYPPSVYTLNKLRTKQVNWIHAHTSLIFNDLKVTSVVMCRRC